MKKLIVFILVIGCLGYFSYKYFNKPRIEENVLYGNVEIKQVDLGFQIPGKLIETKFDEGDEVKEGELLASLDDKDYKIKLSQARAMVEQSQVLLNNANGHYKRNIELCDKNIISKQDCDNIKDKKKEAEANLEYTKTLVSEAESNLEHTNLYSPSNGIIITKVVEKGTVLNPSSPVYILSLNETMWVRAFIEETMLGKIQLGQKVKILTDSDRNYLGTIGFISPTAEFTPKNIETPSLRTSLVYRIRITIDSPDNFLKQGMPVTIKIDE